jgi:hypothetical protein
MKPTTGLMKIALLISLFFVLFLRMAVSQTIIITAESGVPDDVKARTQAAIDNTIKFFKEDCGIELSKTVRILLVADDDGYLQAQIRENGCDEEEAARRVKTTKGWSKGDLIIQNVGGMPEVKQRIFNMSHEIVHQVQSSLCSGKCNQLMWMFEGTADALAIHMVEKSGEQGIADYIKSWKNILKKAENIPLLNILTSKDDWYASLNDYKNNVSYRVSGMAVMNLLKTNSFKDIFGYFKKLKDADFETAFKESFGIDAKEYESKFSEQLEKQLQSEE